MSEYKRLVSMAKKYLQQMKGEGVTTVIASGKAAQKRETRKTGILKEPLAKKETYNSLDNLAEVVKECKKCPLAKSRKNVVFGEGNPRAKLMFIGEGPGFDEDRQGRPFVGRAGQQLDKIITAPASLGMKREDVYIANIENAIP